MKTPTPTILAAMACTLSWSPSAVAFLPPAAVAGSIKQPASPGSQEAFRAGGAVESARVGALRAAEGESPVSRLSLLEGALAAFATSAAALSVKPSPAEAKIERIKGGGPVVTLEDGATYQEMTLGDGASPFEGDRVAVHYSLFYNGLEVESSRDSQGLAAQPLGYTCGVISGPGSVPAGLDECVRGMQVGGRRKITLPPQLAFGKGGRPPFIPADATVQFDVSLWSVKRAGTDPNVTLPGSSLF